MLFWLNLSATIKDMWCSIGCFFKNIGIAIIEFFISVFRLARNLVYGILCLLFKIGTVAFLVSFYFIYKCVEEYNKGVAFKDMENLQYALFLFFVPIGITILKEIVKPKK